MNNKRIAKIKHGDSWDIIPFSDLKAGDIFQLFNFDGTPIPDDILNFDFTAISDAIKLPKSDMYQIKIAGDIAVYDSNFKE